MELDPLELELQMLVGHSLCVLGFKPVSLGRGVGAVIFRDFSPASMKHHYSKTPFQFKK